MKRRRYLPLIAIPFLLLLVGLFALGGKTNLSFDALPDTIQIFSSTGDDITLSEATTTDAGVLSADDKTKLDAITSSAGGYLLGPQTHTFGSATSTRAAAESDRDDYESNAVWLDEYDEHPLLLIRLHFVASGDETWAYQRRNSAAWEDITLVITGPEGPIGHTGAQGATGPQGAQPQVMVYYGSGQTGRLTPIVDRVVDVSNATSSRMRLVFEASSPDQTYFGGDSLPDLMMATSTISSLVDDWTTEDSDATLANNVVFRLPQGIWHIRLFTVTEDELDSEAGIRLRQATTGVDAILAFSKIGYTQATGEVFTGEPRPSGVAELHYLYFKSTGVEPLYFDAITADDTQADRAYYGMFEKVR